MKFRLLNVNEILKQETFDYINVYFNDRIDENPDWEVSYRKAMSSHIKMLESFKKGEDIDLSGWDYGEKTIFFRALSVELGLNSEMTEITEMLFLENIKKGRDIAKTIINNNK